MIIQGGNEPIRIIFDEPPSNVSLILANEILTYKHWDAGDFIVSNDGKEYEAPIEQSESRSWEEGRCQLQLKWMDGEGVVQFYVKRDWIVPWDDHTILV